MWKIRGGNPSSFGAGHYLETVQPTKGKIMDFSVLPSLNLQKRMLIAYPVRFLWYLNETTCLVSLHEGRSYLNYLSEIRSSQTSLLPDFLSPQIQKK